MNFIVGDKEEFTGFLNSIGKKDRIAIVSHTDLDGIGSAILIGEMLKSKGLEQNIKYRKFLDYRKNLFSDLYEQLRRERLSTVFISDLNPENVDSDGFEKIRGAYNTFTIDHHPVGQLRNLGNIIKTETSNCSTFVCYELGKELIDAEKWKWLVCAALVSDVSYKDIEILRFIRENYPDVTEANINESEIGKISSVVSSSLIYFAGNPEKVFDLIKKRKLKQLEGYDIEVREEVAKWMKKYQEEADYSSEKNLYFYYYNPKFNITSIVTSILSTTNPDATFVSVSDIKTDDKLVKVSARNHNSREDMIQLMKRGMKGLENAVGGGHVPAAGGSFMKADLEKFKRNILEQL